MASGKRCRGKGEKGKKNTLLFSFSSLPSILFFLFFFFYIARRNRRSRSNEFLSGSMWFRNLCRPGNQAKTFDFGRTVNRPRRRVTKLEKLKQCSRGYSNDIVPLNFPIRQFFFFLSSNTRVSLLLYSTNKNCSTFPERLDFI